MKESGQNAEPNLHPGIEWHQRADKRNCCFHHGLVSSNQRAWNMGRLESSFLWCPGLWQPSSNWVLWLPSLLRWLAHIVQGLNVCKNSVAFSYSRPQFLFARKIRLKLLPWASLDPFIYFSNLFIDCSSTWKIYSVLLFKI